MDKLRQCPLLYEIMTYIYIYKCFDNELRYAKITYQVVMTPDIVVVSHESEVEEAYTPIQLGINVDLLAP